jgi:hypothetical protein
MTLLGDSKAGLNASLRSGFGNRPTHFVGGDISKTNNNLSVIRDDEWLGAFAELARLFFWENNEI